MRTILYLAVACVAATISFLPSVYAQGTITTIAGNGITQYIGDGFPATDYSLALPIGICTDKYGNVFEADYAVARIRKVTPDGTLSTYAGTGDLDYTGDGGPATAATFNNPTGVAIDTVGNIYVLEEYNNVIRKIDAATGIITTICGNGGGGFSGDGGPATAAHMEQPAGLCLDKEKNIYIADKGNNRIRKVAASTGLISTIAGGAVTGYTGDDGPASAALLSVPSGLCTDPIGNLYIADYGNNCIRKIDAATGIITTIAGNGLANFSGDGGPAKDAELAQPNSVFMSSKGNLYISDYGNNRVRAITPDGIIHTLAGSGLYGYAGDGGLAESATFLGPTGVCADEMEYVYISDGGNSAIRKVTPVFNSVKDIKSNLRLNLFPNPTTGEFRVTTTVFQKDVSLSVYNTAGVLVQSATFATSSNIALDLSAQPTGMYYVRMQSAVATGSGKVFISK